LNEQGLDELVVQQFNLHPPPANLDLWRWIIHNIENPRATVNIAMVGKYMNLTDAYKSLTEALIHAGIHTNTRVNVHYLDSEQIQEQGTDCLQNMDAILIPGGFGERGIEGKINTARFAREHGIPYLGICLGMQVAVIEFARNVAQLKNANSTEFDMNTPYPVIALITEWMDTSGQLENRTNQSDLGGTMRLGSQECTLVDNSMVSNLYSKKVIQERHRHRYEFNNIYLDTLNELGLRITGWSSQNRLVEIIEMTNHPWFVGVQFHPEFNSTPKDSHPLFIGFINAARERRLIVY
jgi:CTP synthase